MQLEPGMRVRCVVPDGDGLLRFGERYIVQNTHSDGRYITLSGVEWQWQASRFRPVVRVKAGAHRTGIALFRFVLNWWKSLTPEQQAEHLRKQRDSFGKAFAAERHRLAAEAK